MTTEFSLCLARPNIRDQTSKGGIRERSPPLQQHLRGKLQQINEAVLTRTSRGAASPVAGLLLATTAKAGSRFQKDGARGILRHSSGPCSSRAERSLKSPGKRKQNLSNVQRQPKISAEKAVASTVPSRVNF